jgi:MFS family permease
MAGSVNSNMFLCARIIAGLGIGFINAIIPPWVSELSEAHDRGSSFSLVFVSNYLGICIAYWLNFGIRNANTEFRWRFPLAWMIIPLIIVDLALPFLPESPRYVFVVIILKDLHTDRGLDGLLRTEDGKRLSISSANFEATCHKTRPKSLQSSPRLTRSSKPSTKNETIYSTLCWVVDTQAISI